MASDGSISFSGRIRASYCSTTSRTTAPSGISIKSDAVPANSFNIPKNKTRTRIKAERFTGQLPVYLAASLLPPDSLAQITA